MRRKTLILIAVFLGLAQASYLAIRKEPQRGIVRLRMSSLNIDDINRIVLTQKSESVVLARKDNHAPWLLPDGHKADGDLVASMLKELRAISTSDMITEDTGRFVDLNVEGDKATEVRLEKNGRLQALLFVGEGNAPATFYVRQKDTVYRAQGMLQAMALRSTRDWENRRIDTAPADNMQRIAVNVAKKDGLEIVRQRKVAPESVVEGAEGTESSMEPWQPAPDAHAPKGMRFDEAQAQSLAQSLSDLRAERLLDEALAEELTELHAQDAISWTTDGENAQQRTLLIGKETQDNPQERYAQVEGSAQLFTLATSTAQNLLRHWDDMRALNMMAQADFATIKKVSMQLPGEGAPLVFTKNKDDTFTAMKTRALPKNFVVDSIKLRQRAQQALFSRAIKFVGPERPSHGIGKSNTGAIILQDEEGKEHRLLFGRALPQKEGLGFYARGTSGQDVYVISKALHDSLLADADSLAKKAPSPATAPSMAASQSNGITPEMEAQIRAELARGQH